MVINGMCDLTGGVFEHLEIISPTDVDKRLAYMQPILIGSALKKYQEVLVTCKQSTKELAGDERTLGNMSGVSTEYVWTWVKTITIGYDGYHYQTNDKCVNFKRDLWFELGKCM